MSAALDTMSDAELAELRQMQADDAASEADAPVVETPAPAEPIAPVAEPVADQAAAEPAPEAKQVPKQAMDQERDRRKKLEAALAEQNAKHAAELARVQERLDLLTKAATAAVAPAPVAPEAVPDPQQDPLGYVKHVTTALQRQIDGLQQQVANSEGVSRQVAEAQLAQAQANELQNWSLGQEAEFSPSVPDYSDAMSHLRAARVNQLTTMGFSGPQLADMMRQDVIAMAARARETGINFGQMLYEMARSVGYQPKAAPAAVAAPVVQAAPTNGAQQPTPAQRLATVQRGADMATSLGAAGAAPRGELTPQALAEMSDTDFAAILAKVGTGGMKQLFGD